MIEEPEEEWRQGDRADADAHSSPFTQYSEPYRSSDTAAKIHTEQYNDDKPEPSPHGGLRCQICLH